MYRNIVVATALALVAPVVRATSEAHQAPREPQLQMRNIVDSISDAYDFVVVGGGLAGLVLGNRLSANSNYSVLVLEAGGDGSGYEDQINFPGDAYYSSLWTTPLNWAFYTVPQPNANDTVMEWPRGKVLGGSSAINGMYLVRPGEVEINAWMDLLGDMEGAENWSWESMYAAMKKSETFTPPAQSVAQEGDITWNAASHGTNGPIHFSYPAITFPLVAQWSEAAQAAGVLDTTDAYGGDNWGTFVATSAINPGNWTRSYSRSGYLDPLPPRSNYDVLTNAYVTRLLFNSSSPSDNLTADAVEYTTNGGTTLQTVKVNKEVILAGGSIGSPTVLLHSGVGPQDVLDAAGVDVVSALPGVGQYLQDHLSASTTWSTNQTTAGTIEAGHSAYSNSAEFLSYINDAVAYVNSSVLFGDGVSGMVSSILGSLGQYAPSDATVAAGYEAICNATAQTIFSSPMGQIELLMGNNDGSSVNIGAALQHPYSLGSITINSSDLMAYPVINPAYLTNPNDAQILVAGLKLARQIGQTAPLSTVITETYPGPSVQTDDEWDEWMRGVVFTEYHPTSTCAMLPLEQGGVVDANLRVYGLANVRVADASVPPIAFSAHTMSSTYGLAEQASTIILNFWDAQNNASNSSHNSTGTLGRPGGGKKKSPGSNGSSSSDASLLAPSSFFLLSVVAALGFLY